jgi:hypothetical protein
MCACVRVGMCVCMCVCVRVRACVGVCARARAYLTERHFVSVFLMVCK